MGQFIFFALFIIALLAGIFSYMPHSNQSMNPMKFFSDQSGYTAVEERNRKRTEQANVTTSQGLVQVRRQMEEIAEKQKVFSDMLEEAQQVLKNTGKQASQVLAQAQQALQKDGPDVLRLQALETELQDQQRLLVEHGQDLIALNNQLTRDRDWIHDQMDLIDTNNVTTQESKLQGQYTALKDQSADFFDKVTNYDQQTQQYMQTTQDKLNYTARHIAHASRRQQEDIQEKIRLLLDRQREDMLKLADARERSQELMRDQKQNFALSQELLNNSIEHSKELIQEERERAKEKQMELEQKIQDQRDRAQDKQ